MPIKLSDDGTTVVLDLHGARVDEAEALALRAVEAAARRGRSQVKLIHGASTSDPHYRNRTIRHALYDQLEAGALRPYASAAWRAEGYLLLSLPAGRPKNPTRLQLRDVW